MIFVWSNTMPIFTSILILVASIIILRGIARIFRGAALPRDRGYENRPPRQRGRRPRLSQRVLTWECRNYHCGSPNPGHARFCRMCGCRRLDDRNEFVA